MSPGSPFFRGFAVRRKVVHFSASSTEVRISGFITLLLLYAFTASASKNLLYFSGL
jgi:hypothetical protein